MYRGHTTSPRLKPLALAVAIAALNPLSGGPARAQAVDSVSSVQEYSIAAGPLDEALVTIARKSARTILFAPALVAPYRAGPVTGQLTFEEALRRALAGTGLHAEISAGGSVTIRAGAAPAPVSAAAVQPPVAASSAAKAQRQEHAEARAGQEIQSVTVLGQRGEKNYLTDSTSGATRTDTPLSEVPNSVSVVTRLLIDDQQANSLDDMMRNVAGVQAMSAGGTPGGAFAVRGFTVENTMTDGMMGQGTLGNAIPLIGVDHVEVLKGPEAILGGAGARYGGVIDVVMKKPQAQKVRDLDLLLSDYGHESIGVDLAGPVMQDDNRLTYRLVGSDERSDRNFLGYEGIRHDYVAASGGWKDADTSLVVGVDRTVNHDPVVPYTVALGTQPSRSVPLRVLGNSFDGFGYQQTRAYYEFEQRLTSQWSLRSRGSDVEQGLNFSFWVPATVIAAESGDILNRANSGDIRIRSLAMQNDLIGKFSTGALDHTVVVGTDYFHQSTSDLIQIRAIQPFNVFTSSDLPAVASLGTPLVSIPVSLRNGENGVFLQDQIAIGEKWHFVVAVRRATYLGYTDPNTRKWVPNAGVVYSFSPEVSVYTSTNNGYSARAGETESSGTALPPETSRQIEAGVKLTLLKGSLWLTTSVYRIAVNDVANTDPEDSNFYVLGPGQVTKGVEFELDGLLLPGLNVSSSYSYMTVKTDDGTQALYSPKNTASLWMTYRFRDQALQGWGVGAGIFARSLSLGQNNSGGDDVQVPGQAQVDTSVFYASGRWKATLGVKNLFNRRLYGAAATDNYVPVQAPRAVTLTTKIAF